MNQTPIQESDAPDWLRSMPTSSLNGVEFGCSSGAPDREYKRTNPASRYVGVEISSDYADPARRFCNEVLVPDADRLEESFCDRQASVDYRVFGNVLELLKDPWRVLRQIRRVIGKGGGMASTFSGRCVRN
jgi:SAM-dependent methyltransferase